jgi:hypothetical protein
MSDGRANFDIGFDQRSIKTLRVSAFNVGSMQVANEILAKFRAVFLKQQFLDIISVGIAKAWMKKKLPSCEVSRERQSVVWSQGLVRDDEKTGLLINPKGCGDKLGLREGER